MNENLLVDRVTHWFGSTKAVDRASFAVREGELVALLGPSGCGKTTLLRMIAGFIPTREGRIEIGGVDIGRIPAYGRNVGMVFQNYALFPHMTVAQNVAFGLEMRRVAKAERAPRVADALRLVRLSGFENRYPRQLSGGQQQRVAIARALVIRPDVFLLDEPLSNLDAKLRYSVGHEIRELQKSLGLTTVFVTHDQSEAMTLADRLILINEGRIVQQGTADELYNHPVDSFVASFLGHANLVPGRVAGEGVFVAGNGGKVLCDTRGMRPGEAVKICIRPEHARIGSALVERDAEANWFEGTVRDLTYFGEISEYIVDIPGLADGVRLRVQNNEGSPGAVKRGEQCQVRISPFKTFLVRDSPHHEPTNSHELVASTG